VLPADIYAVPPHTRRGGWTWYTGAAGWFYRAGLEWLLGLNIQAGKMHFSPCIPRHWRSYALTYRHEETRYEITVNNPAGVSKGVVSILLDGVEQSLSDGVPLLHDGKNHQVVVEMG
jgi:cyclic beta-1,2-glucan synthetase